ncbi:hypothetical protein [Propioniciclava flava]|uniref:Heavy metal transporter n=1 Tax=Propioniciclava flava TaxID=2072026 RepID=A0A4Q2EFG8_9ACTN|nr:hypothetical protein [Propioniciclava flava]RXW32257.1 hypothetical protein C1706_06745 [Propioniciclava flava]
MGAWGRVFTGLAVAGLTAVLILAGLTLLYSYNKEPLPLADQCIAQVQDLSVPLDVEQTHNASIVVGVATRRGLVPRASTIALATVYQESGIRNLDYGDRDSLGLFQQRPSQGWGSETQVRDPYYASGKFYDALLKVDGWDSGNVNDVAQAVQRSGHPNGYARHVENARRLASALTGETPASFTCLVKDPPTANPEGLATFLTKTLPTSATVARDGNVVTVTTRTNRDAWSAAHIAVGNTAYYGAATVRVGGRTWTPSPTTTGSWTGDPTNETRVTITYPAPPQPTPSR